MCFRPSIPCRGLSGWNSISRIPGLKSISRRPVPTKVPCAEARDEVGDPPSSLAPDLRRRRLVMSLPVRRVAVLVRIEVAFGIGGGERPGLLDGTVRHLQGVGQDEVGPVRGHDPLPLLTGIRRQAEPDPVAPGGPDHGEGDPGVSARGVQDDLSRSEGTASLPGEHHAQGRPVLDRPSGVQPFRLGVDLDSREVPWDGGEPNEWRVADGGEDRALRHGGRCHRGFHRLRRRAHDDSWLMRVVGLSNSIGRFTAQSRCPLP